MGINFSTPKLIKNKTQRLAIADFPSDQNKQKKLWSLWRSKKDELKNDGFSVSKDKNTDEWQILYYFPNDNSDWKSELDMKLLKYLSFISENDGKNVAKTPVKNPTNNQSKDKQKNKESNLEQSSEQNSSKNSGKESESESDSNSDESEPDNSMKLSNLCKLLKL